MLKTRVLALKKKKKQEGLKEQKLVYIRISSDNLCIGIPCLIYTGNLSSIVGPVAWDWGMVKEPMLQSSPSESDQESPSPSKAIATVTILNTNTNKLIKSSFDVKAITSRFSSTVVNDHTKSCDLLDQYKYCPRGAYYISGVSNPGSAIKLSFLNPGGAKTGHILPTGNPIDELEVITPANTSVDDITATKTITVRASLIDVSNPGVFVRADDLFVENFCEMTPEKLAQDEATMRLLEGIRQEGAQRMGMDPAIESVPKVVILFPPGAKTHDTDEIVQDEEEDIRCLALSMGQPHRAVPLTLALCLGAAARMEGTIADELVRMGGGLKDPAGEKVRIAHPSGTVDVGISRLGNGRIRAAELYRTARVMMQGNVFY